MKFLAVVGGLVGAAGVVGCSLLVSTDGLAIGANVNNSVDADAGGGGDARNLDDGDVGARDADAGGTADAADGAATSIAYVQRTEVAGTATGTAVAAPAFAAASTAGNAIVCVVDYASGTVSVAAIVDSAGNSYVRAVGPVRGTGTVAGYSDEVWYAIGIKGGSGLAMTATFSGPIGQKNLSCHEYAGIAPVDGFDQASSQVFSGSGLKVTSPITTTRPIELLFSTVAVIGTVSPGLGFTTRSTIDGDLVQDRVLTALGSYSAQFTCSADCIATAVYFRGR